MLHESGAKGLAGREERGDVIANADPEPQHWCQTISEIFHKSDVDLGSEVVGEMAAV
jgi:hypothetical protein